MAELNDRKKRRVEALQLAIRQLVAALASIAVDERDEPSSDEALYAMKEGEVETLVEVFDDGAVLWDPQAKFADILGRVTSQIYSPPARPVRDRTCPRCHGRGKIQ